METRSNHILVGGVVLALLAVLAAFTVWLAGLSGGAQKEMIFSFRNRWRDWRKAVPLHILACHLAK